MKIIEIIAVLPFNLPSLYACRNQQEADIVIRMLQEQGCIPLQGEVEVPDDFDQFVFDLPFCYAEPSLN